MYNSPVEEIKNKLDILDIVREYTQLQKAGGNWRGLCPFHAEKSPSFFVSPSRQMWHCFGGCSEGGDMFKFIMKTEGVGFAEALKFLAARAGVELPKRDASQVRWETERKRLLELLEWATRFFEAQFEGSPTGKRAKEYLTKRKVTEESMKIWRIGYAPESTRALCDFLLQKGFSSQDIGKAGLLAYSEGKTFDRFRGRIMFPVCDANSQVIGFGGRIFEMKEGRELAKYLNTPNTPCYDKSRVLYGLHLAKMEIRKQDACILVEGYLDALMAHQAGCKNVVATSGTALTDAHLQIIRRHSMNLIASFDHDAAGEHATKRSIMMAQQAGFAIRVVMMPQGQDPADVASENPAEWERLVKEARSAYDFYFDTALAFYDKTTAEGKRQISQELLPVMKKIPNKIEQAHWVQRLARELQVREEVIQEEMEKVRYEEDNSSWNEGKEAAALPKTRKELLEERIFALALARGEFLSQLTEEDHTLFSEKNAQLLSQIRGLSSLDEIERVVPPETAEFLKLLAFRGEVEQEEYEGEKEFSLCLEELRELVLRARLNDLALHIKNAEEAKDTDRLSTLLKEFDEVSRKFHAS
ncbi:MAG: DNA primase [Candidatus Yanofskybacteria bacterium]|nr:DNA primase [Candidatus Yanofskybacteria bacterium]